MKRFLEKGEEEYPDFTKCFQEMDETRARVNQGMDETRARLNQAMDKRRARVNQELDERRMILSVAFYERVICYIDKGIWTKIFYWMQKVDNQWLYIHYWTTLTRVSKTFRLAVFNLEFILLNPQKYTRLSILPILPKFPLLKRLEICAIDYTQVYIAAPPLERLEKMTIVGNGCHFTSLRSSILPKLISFTAFNVPIDVLVSELDLDIRKNLTCLGVRGDISKTVLEENFPKLTRLKVRYARFTEEDDYSFLKEIHFSYTRIPPQYIGKARIYSDGLDLVSMLFRNEGVYHYAEGQLVNGKPSGRWDFYSKSCRFSFFRLFPVFDEINNLNK